MDDSIRLTSCDSKTRYPRRRDAERAMKRIRQNGHAERRNYDLGLLIVYPCRYCDGFHLGHDSNKRRNPANRSVRMDASE